MAPETRAKSVKADAKDPNPKQTIKSKLYINTREDDSKNSKRCGHCGASVRANSKSLETDLEYLGVKPVAPRESAEVPSPTVLPEWTGRRRRNALLTRDELQVADFLVTEDFRRKWASGSATATMVQMKKDPNYTTAPVQKSVSSKAKPDSTGLPFDHRNMWDPN